MCVTVCVRVSAGECECVLRLTSRAAGAAPSSPRHRCAVVSTHAVLKSPVGSAGLCGVSGHGAQVGALAVALPRRPVLAPRHAARAGSGPRQPPVLVARGSCPCLWPVAAARACGPRQPPVPVARGSRPCLWQPLPTQPTHTPCFVHARSRTHAHARTCMHTHTHAPMRPPASTHARTHASAQRHTLAMRARTHTHTHTRACAFRHTRARARAHTHVQTSTNTVTRTHRHTDCNTQTKQTRTGTHAHARTCTAPTLCAAALVFVL
jgi:hypothetical protein